MDFNNLYADVTKILTTHYTSGRGGNSINKVIIHHMAGNLTIDGCYSVWQSREASAHYAVQSDGKIGQLVYDSDTAWHAGNFSANQTSIGIEHADASSNPWRISDSCLESGAHLVAALCKYYDLGRPQWGKNVFGHSDFSSTECPASLARGGSQHDAYMRRAQEWYDSMTSGKQSDDSDKRKSENMAEYGFSDVSDQTAHADDIKWLLDTGVSTGYVVDREYRPAQTVTRADAAAMIHRLAARENVQRPLGDMVAFSDVDGSTPHVADITWMGQANISTGYPDGTFRPFAALTRADCAAFLYRLAGSPEFDGKGGFSDVSDATPHATAIRWMAGMGVARGYGDGTFRPSNTLKRGDFAAFLHRMADKAL